MMSDESENDGAYVETYQNDVYYKKYKLLLERCQMIQKYNERLVFRITEVKKIVVRRTEEVGTLKEYLYEECGEDWRIIPKEQLKEEDEEDVKPLNIMSKIKEEKDDYMEEKPLKPVKKPTKRKSTKTEKDPNAPKRPSNPFFQFCQEQRQILMEQINAELKPGEIEPSKQELTRQLALKWKSMSIPDKQRYVDMYEVSKEKYAVEMSEYNMKK